MAHSTIHGNGKMETNDAGLKMAEQLVEQFARQCVQQADLAWLSDDLAEVFLEGPAGQGPHPPPAEDDEPEPAGDDPLSDCGLSDLDQLARTVRRAADGATGQITAADLDALRRGLARRSAPDGELVFDLSQRGSVDSLLHGLLAEARRCGLKNLRFYCFRNQPPAGPALVSFASAGHDPTTELRLKVGQITKFLSTSPLESYDSFWSLALCVPVVFVLDDGIAGEVECLVGPDSLPLVRVRSNRCENVLTKRKASAWVDFVLIVGGVILAKLSCDVQGGVRIREGTRGLVDPAWTEEILCFNQLLQMLAPRLDVLHRAEEGQVGALPPLHEFGAEVRGCESLAEACDLCADRLPQVLGCRYGSILTVSRDALGSELLVLRRTSFEKSRKFEHRRCYRADEPGLTPWVARTGRSICVHDFGDRDLFREKLRQYDPQLVCVNKIPDSEFRGDLLMAAVPGANGRTIAVLRLTEKRPDAQEPHFTQREQLWLEDAARQYIGPKLESLARQEADRKLARHAAQISAMSLLDEVTNADVPTALKVTLRSIFPQDGPGKKVSFVNFLEEDGNRFRHRAIDAEMRCNLHDVYELSGSLTDFALEHDACVFLNDLDLAARRGAIQNVVPQAVSALACRIPLRGRKHGAVAVLSDHYDLDPQVHGPVLKLLADRAGEVLVRRQLRPPTKEPDWVYPLLDGYGRAGRPRGQGPADVYARLNLREVLAMAAQFAQCSLAQERKMECDIDERLTVVAQRNMLAAILSDLLRHAWSVAGKVRIAARCEGLWLEVEFQSAGNGGSPEPSRPPRPLPLVRELLAQVPAFPRDQQIGLGGPRRLASRYRLSDGRAAQLLDRGAAGRSPYSVTLRLPVLPEPDLFKACES